jgi:hypothetical protein
LATARIKVLHPFKSTDNGENGTWPQGNYPKRDGDTRRTIHNANHSRRMLNRAEGRQTKSTGNRTKELLIPGSQSKTSGLQNWKPNYRRPNHPRKRKRN